MLDIDLIWQYNFGCFTPTSACSSGRMMKGMTMGQNSGDKRAEKYLSGVMDRVEKEIPSKPKTGSKKLKLKKLKLKKDK